LQGCLTTGEDICWSQSQGAFQSETTVAEVLPTLPAVVEKRRMKLRPKLGFKSLVILSLFISQFQHKSQMAMFSRPDGEIHQSSTD